MGILLTDEEILKFIDRDKEACNVDECCAIASAQLKKAVEWLDARLAPHYVDDGSGNFHQEGWLLIDEAWQALLKEIT